MVDQDQSAALPYFRRTDEDAPAWLRKGWELFGTLPGQGGSFFNYTPQGRVNNAFSDLTARAPAPQQPGLQDFLQRFMMSRQRPQNFDSGPFSGYVGGQW